MALKLHPTGLGSGIDKDRPDYVVCTGNGRSAASTRRRTREFALVLVANLRWSDDALGLRGYLGEAKAQFQKNWDAWKAWAKMEEVPGES
jgi:hypothetical protein